MRSLQMFPGSRPILALLLLFVATPRAAADAAKDCQSGQVESCTQILQTNPADFAALANRGIGLRGRGEYDRAIADFDAAMRINAGIAGLYLERGLAYDARGDHRPAILDFSEAIVRSPDLVQAHFGRAIAYQAVGEREASKIDMDSALRLDRNMVAAMQMQRGFELLAARRFDEAIAAFDRTIDINPGWPSAYFGRASSFDETGDSEHAEADYHKCIELTANTDLERRRQKEARERLDKLAAR